MQFLCIDGLRVFQTTQPDGVNRAGRAAYARTSTEGLSLIQLLQSRFETVGELWTSDREIMLQLLEWAARETTLRVGRIYVLAPASAPDDEVMAALKHSYGQLHVIAVEDELPYLFMPTALPHAA